MNIKSIYKIYFTCNDICYIMTKMVEVQLTGVISRSLTDCEGI